MYVIQFSKSRLVSFSYDADGAYDTRQAYEIAAARETTRGDECHDSFRRAYFCSGRNNSDCGSQF